ncbi:hypothetical protein [Helicobacter sp.]|uniref:hypothetical protein n=1 Tax=Helicobacter sp. TaxID=218 RepID=UPI0025C58C09|nr:hypothetical protein [Helicobacter sp.]MCI5633482.1 hypothetical protein [Helicobacter sp.]MDY5557028.1 hypothetical protein [Helicobacter sp.]
MSLFNDSVAKVSVCKIIDCFTSVRNDGGGGNFIIVLLFVIARKTLAFRGNPRSPLRHCEIPLVESWQSIILHFFRDSIVKFLNARLWLASALPRNDKVVCFASL